MCASIQHGWVAALLLWADSALRRMDSPRWREEAGVVGAVGLLVRTGDQTAEAFLLGERGASFVRGQCRRIPLAIEVEWVEREYQYLICRESESDDPTIGFEIDAPYLGTSAIQIGTGGSFVLVAGILSFCSSARELASQDGRTCAEKGQTETETV